MDVELVERDIYPVFVKCELDLLLHFVVGGQIVGGRAPRDEQKIHAACGLLLDYDIGLGIFVYELVFESLRQKHLLCEGDVVGVGDGEGHIEPAASLGVVVDNIVARDVRIRDNDALVVDGYKHRIHQLYLVDAAAYVFELNEVAAFKRLVDEYLYAAGKLGDTVLQTHSGSQSRRAEGGYEGVEIEAEGRESGEYDRKSQHPNYYAAKKRVNGRVNALSLKPLYQQLAYKGADPKAERDYYCRSDEFGQHVNELRYKCFKVKCRKFFSHSFFLRFEYDLL